MSLFQQANITLSAKHSSDRVLNYASAAVANGLLLLEYKDAIHKGDGKRILRVWKALLHVHYT